MMARTPKGEEPTAATILRAARLNRIRRVARGRYADDEHLREWVHDYKRRRLYRVGRPRKDVVTK
jgi:hypothetical protein